MTKSAVKIQISFTALTATVYLALAFLVHSQDALLQISSLYHIPTITVIEVLKFIFIKKTYGVQGQSIVTPKPGTVGLLNEGFKFAGLQLGGILLFALICIVLGAPSLSHFDQTLTLSALLTTLTIFPFTLFLGARVTSLLLLTNKLEMISVLDEVYLQLLEASAMGAILGSWAGSVVMPLDWDRSWQVYPIPNIVGAFIGHVAGCLFSVLRTAFVNVKKELSKKTIF